MLIENMTYLGSVFEVDSETVPEGFKADSSSREKRKSEIKLVYFLEFTSSVTLKVVYSEL
jgi:hypothetical protein